MNTDNCDFKINGQPISIDEINAIDRLVIYLQKKKEWLCSAPRYEDIPTQSLDTPKNQKQQSSVKPSPFPISTPIGKRTIDYAMRSIVMLGGTPHMDDVFRESLRLGWTHNGRIPDASTYDLAKSSFTNNVRSTRYKDFVHIKMSRVTLSEKGKQKIEEIMRDSIPESPADEDDSQHDLFTRDIIQT